jgi:acetylornithine/succinyldiaminopimelate/putrescine aminotransferase
MQDRRWPTYAPRNVTLDAFVPDASGRGSMRVRDTDGREYLDAIGGIGCLPLGHGHPRWIAALHAQMQKLVAAAGPFWTEPQQQLAAELVARSPVQDGRVFFGNTGTEVTEGAIKLATRSTGRDVIIAFDNAFHGRSLGSIALTGTKKYRDPYVSTFGEPDDRFARMNVARAPFGDLDAVEALLEEHGARVAMVCLEPIQGEGGIRPASREFLLGVRQLCRFHGALLGLDEIQTGSGRTGNFAAWTTLAGDADVDVIWYAKALGGGYPVAACVARGDLAEHMGKGSHGSTFGGNPLACAAGVATLQIMDEEKLFASAAQQLPTLQRIAAVAPIAAVRELRGCGAMIGIDFGDADFAGRVVTACHDHGLLATQSGGTAIRWLLPFRAGAEELGAAWTALRGAVQQAG